MRRYYLGYEGMSRIILKIEGDRAGLGLIFNSNLIGSLKVLMDLIGYENNWKEFSGVLIFLMDFICSWWYTIDFIRSNIARTGKKQVIEIMNEENY